MTCTLVLMRHGVIKANLAKRWHGSTDSPLLWRGRRQAKKLGRYISQAYPELDALYVSPLGRCQETAAPTSKLLDLDIQTHSGLREWSIGEWENEPFRALSDDHDFFNKSLKDLDWAAPGGESLAEVSDRFVATLNEITKRHTYPNANAHIGIVSHGAAIQVAIASLLDGTPKRWQSYTIGNASVTELILHPKPYIENYNLMHFL